MTPNTPSLQILFNYLTNLIALVATLPLTHLTRMQRVALGPDLPPRARELTDEVALILRLRPAEFPDQPTAAAEIAANQKAADRYMELSHQFRYLAEACLSSHQHHQALAVRCSKDVLKTVLAGANHPALAPHLRHERRVSLLTPAFEVLFSLRRPRRKAGAKAQKETPAPQGQDKARAAIRRRERLADLLGSIDPRR